MKLKNVRSDIVRSDTQFQNCYLSRFLTSYKFFEEKPRTAPAAAQKKQAVKKQAQSSMQYGGNQKQGNPCDPHPFSFFCLFTFFL